MAKYLVETYYNCSFKVSHYLEEVSNQELQNLEKRLNKKNLKFKSNLIFNKAQIYNFKYTVDVGYDRQTDGSIDCGPVIIFTGEDRWLE